MTATSILLILVGLFVIVNSANFVKVLNGEAKIGGTPTPATK